VTLSGELFTSDHMIIAGNNQAESQIARPREKEETRNLLNLAKNDIAKNSVKLQKAEESRSSYRNQIEKLQDFINEQKTKLDGLEIQSQQQKMREEQILQQQKWLDQQISESILIKENCENEIRTLEVDSKSVVQKLLDLDQTISSLSNDMTGVEIDDLQSKVIDHETQKAILDQNLKNLAVRITEKQNGILREQEKFQGLTQQIRSTKDEISQLSDERNRIIKSEKEINEHIEELQKRSTG